MDDKATPQEAVAEMTLLLESAVSLVSFVVESPPHAARRDNPESIAAIFFTLKPLDWFGWK
jgi:hypothetical protein